MRTGIYVEDGVAYLRVSGDVDLATAAELVTAGHEALTNFCGTLRIDLSGVTFLDSEGIGALVAIRNAAEPRHTVILENPREQTRKILAITGLDHVFRIDPPVERATRAS